MVAEARQVGYRPLIAEALNRLVLLQVDMRHPQDADASAEEALWIAEASRHDELVVELAAVEIYVAGYIEHDMTKARRWINQAQVFLERIGGHDLLRAWVLNNIGVVLDANGDHEGAAAQLLPGAAHQGARARQGPPRRRLHAVQPRRHAARARAHERGARRSSTAASRSWGAPSARATRGWSPSWSNRAEILNQLGRSRRGAARRRARDGASRRARPGPHTEPIYALGPLGEAQLGLGHPAAAIDPIRARASAWPTGRRWTTSCRACASRWRARCGTAAATAGGAHAGDVAAAAPADEKDVAASAGTEPIRREATAWLAAHVDSAAAAGATD